MYTSRFVHIVAVIFAVLVIVTVASCASSDPMIPQADRLYPGVYVEVVGEGYYNPNCGKLRFDYILECEPLVPTAGNGRIKAYEGDAEDPFSGKWSVNGKFRVCVEEFDMTRDILPGCGWYPRESLRFTHWRPTPFPTETSTSIPTTVVPATTVTPGATPSKTPRATPVVRPTVKCFAYTVIKDDTLYDIVKRKHSKYNLVLAEVIADNPGMDPDNLQIGQKINICPR